MITRRNMLKGLLGSAAAVAVTRVAGEAPVPEVPAGPNIKKLVKTPPTPAYSFSDDGNTGMYQPFSHDGTDLQLRAGGCEQVSIVVKGKEVARFTEDGLEVI